MMDLHKNTGTGSETPPPRQEGMTDARREPMTREALQRVTAQIRAWDKQSVAFDAAIQQIHAHDAAQSETIARLQQELIGKERAGTILVEKIAELKARLTASEAKRKWTRERPTKAGWYWVRFTDNRWVCTEGPEEWCVVQAWEDEGRMVCSIKESAPLSELNCGFTEWSGPIVFPEQGPLTPGEE